jgi:hypothetical protein
MLESSDKSIIEYLGWEISLTPDNKFDEYYFINNPDGSIRWLYPKGLKSPTFLNFYSTSSLRAKFFSNCIKLMYFFEFKKIIKSGSIGLRVLPNSKFDRIIKNSKFDSFSLFTGTKGENRKAILELNRSNKTFVFIKIALNDSSQNLVENEIDKLEYLGGKQFKTLVIPEILDSQKELGIVELSNIKPNTYSQDVELERLHFKILNEIAQIDLSTFRWNNLPVLNFCKKNIISLQNVTSSNNGLGMARIEKLTSLLVELYDYLGSDDLLSVGLAHGDFTPWNMYITKSKIFCKFEKL